MLLRVAAYGTASADAEVTAQLVGPRGATLAELPIHSEGEGAGFSLELPLSSLATGEFLIAIAARTPRNESRRSCRCALAVTSEARNADVRSANFSSAPESSISSRVK